MDLEATADQPPGQDKRSAGQPSRKGGWAEEGLEIIKTIFYALAIALVLRVLLFQPFTIPSGSMIPNLQIGDYILVSKFSYGYSRYSIPLNPPLFKGRILGRDPKPGDIVVFKFPGDLKQDYIKRLVGLPGDRIQVLDGQLLINDKPVPAEQIARTREDLADSITRAYETLPNGRRYITQDMGPYGPADNTTVFLVPPGHYFMMGDNRDNSSDSRVDPTLNGVGFVPAENLVGKAQMILFSWDGASFFKPWTWVTKARWARFFHPLN